MQGQRVLSSCPIIRHKVITIPSSSTTENHPHRVVFFTHKSTLTLAKTDLRVDKQVITRLTNTIVWAFSTCLGPSLISLQFGWIGVRTISHTSTLQPPRNMIPYLVLYRPRSKPVRRAWAPLRTVLLALYQPPGASCSTSRLSCLTVRLW